MSIQPGDLRVSIERTGAVDTIRRIERDQSAQEFGQKEKDSNRKHKNAPHASGFEEEPQDVVDVSSAYHPPEIVSSPGDPHPETRRSESRILPSTESNHHIDIKV
jgi:hypothetical protein